MNCLTDEQRAGLALGIVDDGNASAHAEHCDACRAKLSNMRRLTDQLVTAHSELDRTHAASRAQLLAKLSTIPQPAKRVGAWKWLAWQLDRFTIGQRVAAGGVGLTTIIGLTLLFLVMSSAGRLSAMERMVRQLRTVTSYRYEMYSRNTFVPDGETKPATVIHTGTTYWVAPNSLRYDEKIVKTEGKTFSGERDGLLAEFQGIHPSGMPGLMVHHFTRYAPMVRTYTWIPEVPAHKIGDSGPIMRVRMVREGEGQVLRELGTKQINGKTARGFIMALADANPDSGFDSLEVWVDPETDLPLEFGYEVKDGDQVQAFRIFNCQWNIEIPPAQFDTTPPAGYEDITGPQDEESFSQITEALRLYARLSGGRYPQGSPFVADAVCDEMLKLAGYTRPAQPEWKDDPTFQEIERAKPGLNWLERTLRHRFATGYDGAGVTLNDKDKPLLWWAVDVEDSYRVFYGDLRMEIVPYSQWLKIVPPEVVADQQPRGTKVD
jgi:outer membrane lipoprotein-sorting protein